MDFEREAKPRVMIAELLRRVVHERHAKYSYLSHGHLRGHAGNRNSWGLRDIHRQKEPFFYNGPAYDRKVIFQPRRDRWGQSATIRLFRSFPTNLRSRRSARDRRMISAMMVIGKLSGVLIVSFYLAACSSPSAPTPQAPPVAGTYSGVVTVNYPQIPRSVSCAVTTVVTQSGGSINIAPLVLGGPCGNVSIPMGSRTIDSIGALEPFNGTVVESCGTYTVSASGGFFGRELRLSMVATSTTCITFNFTAVLNR